MFAQYAREGTLAASTSGSTSLSLTDAIDLDIVDEILSQARDATSFAQVHEAYSHVLEAHGIRPSSDKLYYQFLLKLGMIRAGTWGERWYMWRESHDTRRRAPSPSPAGRVVRPTALRAVNPMRARVPFLASASSDLDDGYGDDGDGVDATSEAETVTSEVVPLRLSPRKAFATAEATRSMVGYTPTPSDIDDSMALHAHPIRTSTPLAAQDRGFFAPRLRAQSRTPTRLPSYSESEADVTITSPVKPIFASRFSLSQQPSQSQISAGTVEREVDPALLREMELRADRFHRLGLVGRCWGAWRQSTEWIHRTTAQIDKVRDTLLLQQTLQKWRRVHEHRLSQPGTADAHYEHRRKQQVIDCWLARLRDKRLKWIEQQAIAARQLHDKRSAFNTWHTKVVKLRTKRWEDDMRGRASTIAQKFETNRARRAFDKWHDAARERTADKHHVTTTLKNGFRRWKSKADKSRLLAQNLLSLQRRTEATTIVRTFDLWSKKTALRPLERRLVAAEERRVAARVWSKWQLLTQQQLTANAFDTARVLKFALDRMKAGVRLARKRERALVEYEDSHDAALMRRCMNIWLAQERGKLLHRVLETRRVRSMFAQWKAKTANVAALDSKAEGVIAAANMRHLHNSLSRWRDVLGQRRNATLKADLIFEARTKHMLFTKWHAARAKLADDSVTADKARAFFTLRTSFMVWRLALARRRQDAFVEQQKSKTLKRTLDAWRVALVQSVHDKRQIGILREAQNRRILKHMLSAWTERVVEIKARELDVAEQRDKMLVADTFGRWQQAHRRKLDMHALMQSFLDVKREESMRRAFMTWAVRTRKAADLHRRLEVFEKERNERLLGDTLAAWHDQKRERDLRPVEAEVALRREDALLFSVFDAWIGRGRLLRAVQFDKQRLARAAFPRWKRALARQQKIKAISAERDERLLADGFAVWKAAYRAKIAKRPVHRARRRLLPHNDRPENVQRASSATPPATAQPARRLHARHSLGTLGEGARPSATAPQAPPASRSRYRPAPAPRGARGGSESPHAHAEGDDAGEAPRAVSVASEPAYSRLRSELLGRGGASASGAAGGVRPRVLSDETAGAVGAAQGTSSSRGVPGTPGRSRTMAELVHALRAAK